jgi:hypothetical protein
MARYAEKTTVSSDSSRNEIERTLTRYGAESFMYASRAGEAVIAFEARGRRIKFHLPLPAKSAFARTPDKGLMRSTEATQKAWEQGCRQRWRALALAIKAKLEAVEAGITTFEDEFLAHIMLPNGETVGEHIKPGIALAYERGEVPALLPPRRDA